MRTSQRRFDGFDGFCRRNPFHPRCRRRRRFRHRFPHRRRRRRFGHM